MIITAVVVCSIDGFIVPSDGRRVASWSSAEDKEHFFGLVRQATGIVKGRKTWWENRDVIKLTPKTLRTVITREPAKFAKDEVAGQLEFSSASPAEIAKKYQQAGHQELLVLGGSEIYRSFLSAGVVDKLVVTVEPVVFGAGVKLFSGEVEQELQVESVRRLNERGSLVVSYKINL
jgi:dihydrofolate reductase